MSYSSSSTGTSSSHDNGMEGEVVSSSPAGCVCNLPIIFLLELLKHFNVSDLTARVSNLRYVVVCVFTIYAYECVCWFMYLLYMYMSALCTCFYFLITRGNWRLVVLCT